MARNSIANAKAELFALLATDTATGAPVAGISTYVNRVYDHEPKPGDLAKPCSATIASLGMSPNFYRYALRIYQTVEIGAKAAWDNLELAVLAVDALITNGYGPSDWDITYVDEINMLVAENGLEAGRGDNM